jgi:peptide deformylase
MYNLVPETEEILHKKLEPFDFNKPPVDPEFLAREMLKVLQKYNALGVSANQLGLPHRVFVMKSYPGDPFYAAFNPKVVNVSNEVADYKEGCLTYPGLAVKIRRPVEIRVRFQSPYGEVITKDFKGIHARMFQHEMDHMDGRVYYEGANFLHRTKALKDWKNLKRRGVKLVEVDPNK